jgi:Arc/MetJ family transcription regulator
MVLGWYGIDMSRRSYRRQESNRYTAPPIKLTATQVHRTTVDIEVDALEEAKAVLGTTGYRDTVNGALREVARIQKLRRLADRIRSGELTTITPEEARAIRQNRY